VTVFRGVTFGLILSVAVCWGPLACVLMAQEKPAAAQPSAPTLTSEQKKDFQIVILRIQLAQAQMQQAQQEANALLQSFQREGWTFDPQAMTYAPAPKPAEKKP
jgi:hypothetical protein